MRDIIFKSFLKYVYPLETTFFPKCSQENWIKITFFNKTDLFCFIVYHSRTTGILSMYIIKYVGMYIVYWKVNIFWKKRENYFPSKC